MKTYLSILFLFCISISFSQTFDEDQGAIIEAETKSASHRIYNRAANINTGNYDVTYHKLEFTIDPSVADISGIVLTAK